MNRGERRFVIGKLRQILKVCDLPTPARSMSIMTPLLAHEGYKSHVMDCLSKMVRDCQQAGIPLHEPRAPVVETPWSNVQDKLFDFEPFIESFLTAETAGVHATGTVHPAMNQGLVHATRMGLQPGTG